MQLTFSTSHIGLVELYQGSEKLADVVNPRDDRNDLYVFVAKSAEVPRAVAYGGGGQRFEAVATPGVKGPPPPDASPTRPGGADSTRVRKSASRPTRPPATPARRLTEDAPRICPTCYMALPATGVCDYCA